MEIVISIISFFAPLLGISMFVASIVGVLTFDELIKLEHQEFHSNWEKDGKPYGFFWQSRESNFFTSSFARNTLLTYWFFAIPKWMLSSTQAMKLHKRYRIAESICVFVLLAIIMVIISTVMPQ